MSKKIAFVVVALVVLVATFCVSFAGVPLADIDVPTIGNPSGPLYIPRSWLGSTVYIDMNTAQSYSQSLADAGLVFELSSPSGTMPVYYFNSDDGWLYGSDVFSFRVLPFDSGAGFFVVLLGFSYSSSFDLDDSYEQDLWRISLPDDVIFKVYRNDVDVTSQYLSRGVLPNFGYFMSIEVPYVPTFGEMVINNIVDTLWGTLVSVGESFGIGLNQMVGELFFDLETGELAPFSIVIICFFALCLIISLVNWLFRLAHLKKL